MIRCCYENILEKGAVSLSAGTAHADYPLYRLYDRNIGRVFKTAAAVTTEIKIDQGASPAAIDRLLIPSGHNLAGMTLDIMHSADNVAYTPAVAQWAGASGLIEKTWASLTKRYWLFRITNPASAPQVTELFLARTYEWERDPALPSKLGTAFNVERETTANGEARFLIRGEPRRRRVYAVRGAWETQKKNITTLNDAWRGSMPFFLKDEESEWIFGGLDKDIEIVETGFEEYSFVFDFIEVVS